MDTGVSFGRYRFVASSGQLWSGHREVRLTPKAAAVLAALVAHAGQTVTREDLFAEVWCGTAVGDDALTSCIQELRKALADDPKQPRFIETRHRRGYRFVARLRHGPGEAPAEESGTRVEPPNTGGKPTVAVLPFENMSGDADQEYLSDGINVAVAEKVSALRTEEYFAERAARGNVSKALRILKRAGVGNPPVEGDELPPAEGPRRKVRRRSTGRRR